MLDVLHAEQELLNRGVVGDGGATPMSPASQLLNAMGQAEADDLGLEGGPLYDPLGNYRRVAGNWNDWAGEPQHRTVATRTVTPEEDAVPATNPPPDPTGVTPTPQ